MTGVLIGVLGALAVAATGVAIKWGRSIMAAIGRRIRPDHRTLHGGRAWGLPAQVTAGGQCSIRVLVACAPSRSLPRTNAIDPDLAIPFVRESFPDMFPDQPAVSLPQEVVRFSADPDGSSMRGYAQVWPTGRVDLAVDIALDSGPDQRFMIPLMEVLRPIALMATAVSGPGYARVFGHTRSRQPRRFDWFIAVSTTFLRPDALTVQWDGMTFPGRCPPRAGSTQINFCPTGGYARERLRNWKAGSPVSVLLAAFLEDFLKQNGYHDVADAVADVIAVTTKSEVPAAKAADSLPAPQEHQKLTTPG
jgi:hypothetical protein